jgi:hypothetical protein
VSAPATAVHVALVACRYCGALITLNPDSAEARERGQDPAQQLRQHLTTHMQFVIAHARNMGWLLDALAFECPHDPNLWRKHLEELLNHCRSMELATQ